MITDIYIHADSWAEAVQDLEKFKATFNNKCRVSIKVAPPIVDTAGYSFNWLANDSSDAKTEFVNGIVNEVTEKLTAAVEKSSAARQYKTQEGTNMLGEIEFNVITDMTKLPQKVASAASAIETTGLMGADYKPIIFCGTQLVRGTNYLFIAEQTRSTATPTKRVVSLKVNEFQGKFDIVKDSIKVIFG